jgi:uncharacterized membrane protein YbaN (DUF454 family)
VLLTVFSLIALTAFTNDRDGPWNRPSRWVISVTSISLGLSVIGAVASLFMTAGFATTSIELILVVIILGFWCAGLPAILDPNHRLGQSGTTFADLYILTVLDANLFFFSWAAFFVGLKLLGLHLAQLLKRKDDKFLSSWIFLTAASFITMASATHLWRDAGCNSTDVTHCARNLFALILGAVSGLIGLILIFVPALAIHQIMSIILLAAWCFEISYITFEQGPVPMINTLYFASWAALITSLCIGALSFFALAEKAMGRTAENDNVEPAHGNRGDHGDRQAGNVKLVVDIKNDPEDREFEEVATPAAMP